MFHHSIENFINNVIGESCRENDLIPYIEKENKIIFNITDKEKQVLIQLVHFNITYKKNEREMRLNLSAFLDRTKSFDSGADDILRVSIVDLCKKTGIVTCKIESGRCRVGDRCIIMPNRTYVTVANIYYEENETNSCVCGDNVRLKLKCLKEEILPGFILCNPQQTLCVVGRVFDAQVAILQYKSTIRPGYSAVIYIHTAVAKVQLKTLITLINYRTGETTQENPKFLKQGQVAIARFELLRSEHSMGMELFERFPQLGRFTLYREGETLAAGNVLQIIE